MVRHIIDPGAAAVAWTERMLISVVVCTCQQLESLNSALQSLCQLQVADFIDWEVVVVDRDSSLTAQPVVNRLSTAYPAVVLRYVGAPQCGVAEAWQRGVAEAWGTWVAFVHDDQRVDARWLTELAQLARERKSMCVGGRVRLLLPDTPPPPLGPCCRRLLGETVDQPEPRRFDHRFRPAAGNIMIHRTAIQEVGGFIPSEGEQQQADLFLEILQAGYACWYTPQAVVYRVIPAGRLTQKSLDQLARTSGIRKAEFEQAFWRWLFPLVWLAEVGRLAAIVVPGYLTSQLSPRAEGRLELRCRLAEAVSGVLHGLRLLFRLGKSNASNRDQTNASEVSSPS